MKKWCRALEGVAVGHALGVCSTGSRSQEGVHGLCLEKQRRDSNYIIDAAAEQSMKACRWYKYSVATAIDTTAGQIMNVRDTVEVTLPFSSWHHADTGSLDVICHTAEISCSSPSEVQNFGRCKWFYLSRHFSSRLIYHQYWNWMLFLLHNKMGKVRLQFSVAFWHMFRGTGGDPFGAPTKNWPWDDGPNSLAMAKRISMGITWSCVLGPWLESTT